MPHSKCHFTPSPPVPPLREGSEISEARNPFSTHPVSVWKTPAEPVATRNLPHGPPPWPGVGVQSSPAHPAPTRYSGHKAQGSQHTKRSQGLHVEATFSPFSLLRIDLFQCHGDKPERAGAQSREGRGRSRRKDREKENGMRMEKRNLC